MPPFGSAASEYFITSSLTLSLLDSQDWIGNVAAEKEIF